MALEREQEVCTRMYRIDDHIMYGYEGVCRVVFVGHPNVSGLNPEREYYLLESVKRGTQVYTPVDTKMAMRPVLSCDEIQANFAQLTAASEPTELPTDTKSAAEFYRTTLQTQNFLKILSLFKALLDRQKRQMEIRKTLSTTDLRFFKQAEDLLCGEICFVLGINSPECARMLREKCAE